MIADYEIRLWLARYLHKEISLDKFEDWIAQHSWNMHLDSDESAQKIAAAIELRLAEHSSGHLPENQLRNELVPFVTTYNAVVHFGNNQEIPASSDLQNKTSSPRVFVIQGEEIFQVLSDTQRAVVSL